MNRFSSLFVSAVLALLAGLPVRSVAQSVLSGWETSDRVNTVVVTGNTVYIGGHFLSVYPSTSATGRGAMLHHDGTVDRTFPRVNGNINAVIPDGSGGVYIGGSFTEVGSVPRQALARINADGTVHPWNPGASSSVYALLLRGDTLFVGGNFSTLSGQARLGLGAIGVTSGTLLPWNPTVSGGVYALAATEGTLFAGGTFSAVGGVPRTRLAAFDITTGTLQAWQPAANHEVRSLAAVGTTVYAGGYFTEISGSTRNYLAVLDTETGAVLPQNYNVPPYGYPMAFLLKGDTLFVGGNFSLFGGQARSGIAAINTTNGAVLPWTIGGNVSSAVNSLTLAGDTLYFGGSFTAIGGQVRNYAASVLVSTATLTTWHPNFNETVYALAPCGGGIYAGGLFTCAGSWLPRYRLAAFDLATGEPTGWNPSANNTVHSLVPYGDTLFVGGSFALLNNQLHWYLGAVHATTGTVLGWDATVDGTVYGLTLSGSMLYAGGVFSNVGGQAHSRIAAIDATTASVLPWNIDANNSVFTIKALNGVVYAGGDFSSVAGQTRNRVAAIDATTGTVTAWTANASSTVQDIAADGNTVYIGGEFTSIGGQTRYRLAAVDAGTGAVQSWNPVLPAPVYAVAPQGGTVYTGGYFTTAGGMSRPYAAALDTTGTVHAWNMDADNLVRDIAVAEGRLCIGGSFSRLGSTYRNGFAIVSAAAPAVRLAVTSVSPSTPAGRQPVTIVVEAHTAAGEPMAVTAATLVGLQFSHPQLAVYSGSTQAVIAADTRSTTVTLAFDNTGSSVVATTLTVAALNSSLLSTQHTISVLPPPPPSKLVLTEITPDRQLSDVPLTVTVEARTIHHTVMPVTQATVVEIHISHPQLVLTGGSTEAMIQAGASATTLTLTLRNTGLATVSAVATVATAGAVLHSTALTLTVEPASSQLTVLHAAPSAFHGQAYTLTVGAVNINGTAVPVTQATLVTAAFGHPQLALAGGSTQAVIQAGTSSTTLSVTLLNSSAQTVVTSCTLTAPAGTLAPTQHTLHVEPAATVLALRSITPAMPFSGQTFQIAVDSRNSNGTTVPVTTATPVTALLAHPSLVLSWGATQATIAVGQSSTTLSLTIINTAAGTVATVITVSGQPGGPTATAATLTITPAPAGYTFPAPATWLPNAGVYSMVQSGDTVYMGGAFTSFVDPASYTGAGVLLDTAAGARTAARPQINGTVYTAVPDGQGGLFIGGSFSEINGTGRNYLARLNADGSLHPWNPGANGAVYTLRVANGTVYAGGNFTSIGGQSRSRIAALAVTSATVLPWNPGANNTVYNLAVSSPTVYIGGAFTMVSGTTRNYLAAVDATTGTLTSWNPAPNAQPEDLLVAGSTVYTGGYFTSIGGVARQYLAALDATTGTALAWTPNPSSYIYSLAIDGTTLYAGGSFSVIAGVSRSGFAAFDITTGTVSPLLIGQNGYVYTILPYGDRVYIGGSFTTVAGQTRNRLAAIDNTTGTLLPWNPNINDLVQTVAMLDTAVFAGGSFNAAGTWVERRYLAAVRASTGELLTSWAPSANSTVHALACRNGILYAGGNFSSVNNQSRPYAAAFATATGALLPWKPEANNQVRALYATDSVVYIGGSFTLLGGQARNRLAAVDAATGALRPWNPSASGTVHALAVCGDSVIAGGDFTTIGGQARNRLAAVDAATGALRPWNPSAANTVYALCATDTHLFAGGDFTTIGGQARNRLAAFSTATGALLPWNPSANSTVYTFAPDSTTIYTGGSFTSVGGQVRGRLAAIDLQSGAVLPWNPAASTYVNALAASGGRVHAGGTFSTIAGTLSPNYASVSGYKPAARLAVRSVAPVPSASGQAITAIVDVRTATGEPAAVVQSTTVGLQYAHPSLILVSGSTQATIAAGTGTATLTFALANTGSTSSTVGLTASATGISSTSLSVTVLPPAASRLVVAQVQPSPAASGQSITLTVAAHNSNALPMPVTGATLIGVTAAPAASVVLTGTTQATLAAGATQATLTIVLHNTGNSTASAQLTVAAPDGSLLSTQQNISVLAPPASHLAITGVTPVSPGNALPFTVSVESRNVNNLPMPVTGATVVRLALAHPSLALLSGTTQATIAAGTGTTTFTLSMLNNSATPVTTTLSVHTPAGQLAATEQSITIQACLPIAATITTGTTTLCTGDQMLLTASTAATYLWSNGATSQSIVVSPTVTTAYTVTVGDGNGCTGSTTVTVTVHTPPSAVVTAQGATAFCSGGSVTLTASTAATYLWSNGATSQSIAVSPTTTTIYTVTVASAYGCHASTSVTVTVYTPPSPGIVASGSTTICRGAAVTLTASTAATYLWSNGATSQSIAVSPTTTTVYSVTTASAEGCTATTSLTVVVYDLPLPAPAGVTTACVQTGGHMYTAAPATGATYSWLVAGGSITAGEQSPAVTVTWTTTGTGTVTVTRTTPEGCSSVASTPVVVLPAPVVAITAQGPTTFCAGGSVTLDAGAGFASYLWSNGATTQTIAVATSGIFSVGVSNSVGCTAISTALSVTVHAPPVASVAISHTMPVCARTAVQLTASAGSSYLWSNGATTQTITVAPAATTVYTVTVATAQGCTATTSCTLLVDTNTPPVVSGAPSVCPNTPGAVYQVPALPGYGYQWSVTGGTITAGQGTASIVVTWGTQSAGQITVVQTSPNACTTTATLPVTIASSLAPVITAHGATTLCAGSTVALDAGAGYAWYLWSNGATSQTITVAETGAFSVTVGDAGGCSGSSPTVSVIVHALPTASAGQDVSVCAAQAVQLQASGGVSYSWSPSAGLSNPLLANPIAQPTQTTSYVVTVTNAAGCTSQDTVVVSVEPLRVNIAVMLEGAFNGSLMRTDITANGYLPDVQPYAAAPFSYGGTESVSVIFGTTVDWVLVELRSSVEASSVVGRRAALLRSNGSIVDLDGVSPVTIPLSSPVGNDGLYVVVRHRNHLPVMSATRLQPDQACAIAHNFTTGQQQAYAVIAQPMKQLAPAVFGMIAGDTADDRIIDARDRVAIRNATGTIVFIYKLKCLY